VPRLSLAGQSLRVLGGKIANGWPLILRNCGKLVRRFVLGQMILPK
jgi:hypothetical protein